MRKAHALDGPYDTLEHADGPVARERKRRTERAIHRQVIERNDESPRANRAEPSRQSVSPENQHGEQSRRRRR
jgi:hypothetical protein